MSVIEAAIRGGAVTVLLLVATLVLCDRRQVPTRLYSALFALSVAAYVIASSPGFYGLDLRWRIPIGLVSSGTPAVFWLAAAAYTSTTISNPHCTGISPGLASFSLVFGKCSATNRPPIFFITGCR